MDDYVSISPVAPLRRLKRLRKASVKSTVQISSSMPIEDESDGLDLFDGGEQFREAKLKSMANLEKSATESNKLLAESTDEIFPDLPPLVNPPKSQALESSDGFDAGDVSEKAEEYKEAKTQSIEKSATDPNSLPAESTEEISSSFPSLVNSPDLQTLGSSDGSKASNAPGKGEERKQAKRILDFSNMDLEWGAFGGRKERKKKSKDETSPSLSPDSQGRESSEGFDVGDGSEKGKEPKVAKRVLKFGDLHEEGVEGNEKEKKNKKRSRGGGGGGGGDEKEKAAVSNKRREEKERKMYLQQLHAESQKLLRETRDATFKAIPVVHKPISSVLEKIRQRKLEVMKKTVGQNSNSSFSENSAPFREVTSDDDSQNVSIRKGEADKLPKVLQDHQTVPCETNLDSILANGLEKASTQLNAEDSPSRMVMDEQPIHAFRAPVDDTQDLFSDSQTSGGNEDPSSDQNSSPPEEAFAPSLLAMNLKYDSAPNDDISSDEEDNDKENVKPRPDRDEHGSSSPTGDPVRAFVDEEAEEEDNSDNDMRFHEEDDFDDDEELVDLIATGCEENPADNAMRNELHQKWLEQQDATGTDNLMQRLKYGSKLKETTLFEDEQEDLENDDFFCVEAPKDSPKASTARINLRKFRQMIPQLFADKNDVYVSDEEEAEETLTKQRLLGKVEKQSTLVHSAEDENSKEVFGLIKKLNITPDPKKKVKTSSIFNKMLTGAKQNGFAKPSFIGRKGSHSLPSSNKQGTSTVRSFIFGRDDSNSRSSISVSEDSSDIIMEDLRPTRNVTTKFCSSQLKVSSQIVKSTTETSKDDSLFEILKRTSVQSNVSTVDLTQTAFDAFKIPKKPLRIERRF